MDAELERLRLAEEQRKEEEEAREAEEDAAALLSAKAQLESVTAVVVEVRSNSISLIRF